MADVLKVVAKRIKLARVERDLNQEQLAELLNITQKAVSRWERGNTNIGVETLARIANALDKPMEYFFQPFAASEPKNEQARRRRAA